MNEFKDKYLREALNRREARRTKPEVPADFCDNIMQEIAPKPARRPRYAWYAAFAVAASVAFALLMILPKEDMQKSVGNELIVRKARTPSPSLTDGQSAKVELVASPKQAIMRHHVNRQAPLQISVQTSATDSLDYYINKIEHELAQVDDSLYIERIHRVIHADERLQRIVNNYILNELHKDVRPHQAIIINNNVKTDEDEE
ncbi:MAG: hypothetical protein IKZ62_09090 [Prevotella sp.]|nr:hypothetical protein [Prevotella sp.]